MVRTLPVHRYRLGAEELIEMGRAEGPDRPNRRPFLSGRNRKPTLGAEELIEMGGCRRASLGDLVDLTGNAAPFLASALAMGIDTLSDLSGKTVETLALGADVARNEFSNLLQRVPALANLYAQVLLAGGALVRFGLSVPGLPVRGLGNILAGVASALGEASGDNQMRIDQARKRLVGMAPEETAADVKTVLESSGVGSGDLAPRIDQSTGAVTPEATPSVDQEG